VVAAQGWHLGVVGIVASRLVERFHRPAVVIALDGERGRGSARSVPGIALHEAFAACRDELIAFGGHAAAAGLEIRADRVERFRARLGAALEATAAAAPPGEEAPLAIDARVELRHCSRALVEELARLEPHGRENEPPLFAAEGLALASAPRLVGRNREHLSVLVRQGETVLKAIGFGLGRAAVELERAAGAGPLAAAFRPIVNRWQGAATVELELRDVRSRPEAAESGAACGSWR
jgi:single-stranded-DNA-specific exonuclease